MTPEQEDAHWALMGKPLMRAWRERCRLVALAHEAAENRQPNVAAANYLLARSVMQEAANEHYGVGTIVRYSLGVMTVPSCTVKGAEYTMGDLW